MSLDKEYLRSKVVQGIKLMPSEGVVVREYKDNYGEKESYMNVCTITGTLYANTSNKNISISIQDKGELPSKSEKNFLVDYNEYSQLVKRGDYIFIDNKSFKVLDPGENLEIYLEIRLEESDLILKDKYIDENGFIYELIEVPKDLLEVMK